MKCDGVHLCINCRGLRLPDQRLGENHIAARFADYGRAFLNGEDISDDCTEAFASRGAGWVAVICERPYPICRQCQDQPCGFVARGDVRIEVLRD